jgi:hypothetical protein
MTRPAPPELETLATLAAIESMQGTLALARALVEAGREVELAGLEREAERLCAALACLPEGSAPRLRGPLHGLTQELDRLAVTLSAA